MSTTDQSPDQTPDQTPEQTPDETPDGPLGLPDEPTPRTLQQFPEKIAVAKLPPGAEIPLWAESSSLFSITATATETTVVCAGRNVPTKQVAVRGLTGFAVEGPLDPHEVGVVVDLLAPLAEAGISVFTLSTYDTSWFLVPMKDAEAAAQAWRRRGHTVALAVPVTPSRKSKR